MKKSFLAIISVVLLMAATSLLFSCGNNDDDTNNPLAGTTWQGSVSGTVTSGFSSMSATFVVQVKFIDNTNCVYSQAAQSAGASTSVSSSQGTYTLSSDNKTVTLSFDTTDGDVITERGVISSDGKTMEYTGYELGKFTMTRQ